jgi:hypothetical protein
LSETHPADVGRFPEGDRFPAAANSAEYELHSTGRTLDDLSPQERTAPRPGGVRAPLVWVALALAVLLAFVGWLLVGPPLSR